MFLLKIDKLMNYCRDNTSSSQLLLFIRAIFINIKLELGQKFLKLDIIVHEFLLLSLKIKTGILDRKGKISR